MNEPKKRGRPTKAESEAKAALLKAPAIAQQLADSEALISAPNFAAVEIPGDTPFYRREKSEEDKALDDALTASFAAIPREDTPVIHDAKERALAQAYAERVWSGQSADIKRAERIARCEAALQGQNLPTDGIKYPGSDDEEWTAEDEKPVIWRKAQA